MTLPAPSCHTKGSLTVPICRIRFAGVFLQVSRPRGRGKAALRQPAARWWGIGILELDLVSEAFRLVGVLEVLDVGLPAGRPCHRCQVKPARTLVGSVPHEEVTSGPLDSPPLLRTYRFLRSLGLDAREGFDFDKDEKIAV